MSRRSVQSVLQLKADLAAVRNILEKCVETERECLRQSQNRSRKNQSLRQKISGNVSKSYETIGIGIRLQTTLQSRQNVPLHQTLFGYYFQEKEDSRMRDI